MKRVKVLIMFVSLIFAVSCMDMYNDMLDDLDGYNYYLAVAQAVAGGQTHIYSIDKTGLLTELSVLNNAPTMYPSMLEVNPTGDFLFIPFYGGTGWLGSYRINIDFTLSLISNDGIANIISIVVHPSGNYLYCASGDSDVIKEYSIGNDGTISEIGSSQTVPSGQNRMAVSPNGEFLYVGGTSSPVRMYVYSIDSNGTLISYTPTNIFAATSISSIKVSKNGSVYCTSSSGLHLFNSATNTLELQDSEGANGYITIHPSEHFLYSSSGSVCYLYNIKADNSAIYISSFNAPGSINETLIHPNGRIIFITGNNFLYAYNLEDDGTIGTQLQNISLSSADGLALIRKKK